jgi:potassium-transporting ATPase potassium-binding subunit
VSWQGWLQLVAIVAAIAVTTRLLGPYLARVFGGGGAPGDRIFLPVERLIYRIAGIDPGREQRWNVYALSLLAFSAVSVLGLYLLQRIQGVRDRYVLELEPELQEVDRRLLVAFTIGLDALQDR